MEPKTNINQKAEIPQLIMQQQQNQRKKLNAKDQPHNKDKDGDT